MARIYWVAIERYDVFTSNELKEHLRNAHTLTYNKLPKRTKDVLACLRRSARAYRGRRKLLAAKNGESIPPSPPFLTYLILHDLADTSAYLPWNLSVTVLYLGNQ